MSEPPYDNESASELIRVLLPPSLLADVDKLARQDRRPRSEYVRLVLADHARQSRDSLRYASGPRQNRPRSK